MGPKSSDWYLYRKGKGRREAAQVKMEIEVGVMLAPVKEHMKHPQAGKGKKESSLNPSEGKGPC